MTRRQKQLEAMRRSPQGDWRIADVETLCREQGLLSSAPSGGSHSSVSHPSQPDILTIPARRPIKAIYIRKLIQMIDRVSIAVAEDDQK